MQIKKNYVLGLTLAITLMACGKEEKTKTVTVENQKTVEELKQAKDERDKLKAQLELLGDADALKAELEGAKAELEKANARVAELDKSIKDKDAEIASAKKDLDAAKAAGDKKAEELAATVKKLQGEKAVLETELSTVQADKARLAAQIETAKRDEDMFKNILDYAVARKATDRPSIEAALDKDLKAIDKQLQDLAGQEDGLKSAVTTQAAAVVNAGDTLNNVSKNMKGIYEGLSKRAGGGEALSEAENATLATLKAYFEAAQGEVAEKKTKDGIEKAITGLNNEITALNATLAKAEAELAKFNEELLALALTDSKLESARAKELTKLIAERKDTIAKSNEAKTTKTAALGEQNDLLTASKAKIEALVKTQQEKLAAYQDSDVLAAREALDLAEKELETRVTAYNNFKKETADAQAKKVELTALKDFYTNKLKPAAAE